MPRYLKCPIGETITITVKDLKPQKVVNIVGEGDTLYTVFSKELQDRLGELWRADRANPQGPLVGKTLTISHPDKNQWVLKLGSPEREETPFDESEAEGEVPF